VYNFDVDDLHCYAVGRNGVLVHNDNGPESKPVHIDVGGTGRYPDAINVNSGYAGEIPVTGPPTYLGGAGAAGRPIPNLVIARGEKLPFANRSVDILTLQNSPIRPDTISEIARVIKPGGDIRLVGPKEVVADLHKKIAQRVGGRMCQVTIFNGIENMLFTNIIVPKR
jgi:hypothetical protein